MDYVLKLDTQQAIETPEGIDIFITPAGPVIRSLAWMLDFTFRAVLYLGLYLSLNWAEKAGAGIFMIMAFLIEWFYPVFFEVLNRGQTPAKRMLGLQTLHEDGTPIGWSASIIRNLLRIIDMLPLMYVIGLISMLCNRQFQRLGDIAAGTVVAYSIDHSTARAELPERAAQPAPISLSPEEQFAIVNYAQRFTQLSPERAQELANILAPTLHCQNHQAVEKLLAIANGLSGQGRYETTAV